MLKELLLIGISTCCLFSGETLAQSRPAKYSSKANPISLADSLTPLIDHFNSAKGKPRFVALLSSTCGDCVFGAKAIRESVLNAYPDADIQVSIIWIDMLPSDNEKAAIKSSAIFDDPRVKQFYDPNSKAGYAFAEDLLYKNVGPAWDIYLYYNADSVWNSKPPKPIVWMHQLGGGRRADASRFTPGQKLVKTLNSTTAKMLNKAPLATKMIEELQQAVTNDKTTLNGRAFRVSGMDCQQCANLIESALAKIDGVTEVGADFEQGFAWVGLDAASKVDDAILVKAITDYGFSASVMENAIIEQVESSNAKASKPAKENKQISNDNQVDLQLLSFPDCPNSPQLLERLKLALAKLDGKLEIKVVDLRQLPTSDPRLRYGAPTILLNGADLMGEIPAAVGSLQCRIYPDGVLPTVEEIIKLLQSNIELQPEN